MPRSAWKQAGEPSRVSIFSSSFFLIEKDVTASQLEDTTKGHTLSGRRVVVLRECCGKHHFVAVGRAVAPARARLEDRVAPLDPLPCQRAITGAAGHDLIPDLIDVMAHCWIAPGHQRE